MMRKVRTTITLDDDVAALLARVRGVQSLGLREAVNLGLRQGLPLIGKRAVGRPSGTRAIDTGRYLVDVDDVAAALTIGEGEGRR